MYDLMVRGGILVRPDGCWPADLAVSQGVIAQLGPELEGAARQVIDATGYHVFPGVVDVHVHFNEPGRTEWEGFATGSQALAAGGGTTFCDMPLNSTPPLLDRSSFAAKLAAARESAVTDFAFWGGLVPGRPDALPELAEAGVVGFKAFMADSGLPEFPPADDRTLYDGMRAAAALRLPVAVHAENQALTVWTPGLAAAGAGAWPGDVSEYLAAHPALAEVEAVQRALLLARDTGVALHIVHVSCGRSVALIAAARAEGVDVTLETCPHYLTFTTADLEQIGAALKCAPPVRGAADRVALWQAVVGGAVDIIASDHSPAPPELKDGDFCQAWGGVAGVQSTLPVLLTEGQEHGLSPERVARLLSVAPAKRLALAGKGLLAQGYDADFALVDLKSAWILRPEHLMQRHRISPYVGRPLRAMVRRTVVRGRTVFRDGQAVVEPWGQLVRPGCRMADSAPQMWSESCGRGSHA